MNDIKINVLILPHDVPKEQQEQRKNELVKLFVCTKQYPGSLINEITDKLNNLNLKSFSNPLHFTIYSEPFNDKTLLATNSE